MEGEDVVVVGAANSAGQAVLDLATRARRVTVLCRAGGLEKGMSHYLIERIRSLANVEVMTHAVSRRRSGEGRLEELTVTVEGREQRVSGSAAFVFIGARRRPTGSATPWRATREGFIVSATRSGGSRGRHRWRLGARSLPARDQPARRPSWPETSAIDRSSAVAAAVGEGSMSVQLVHQYLGGMLTAAGAVTVDACARSRSWRPR